MTKRLSYAVLSILLSLIIAAPAQGAPQGDTPARAGKTVSGQRKYQLVVNEGNDSTVTAFNRGLESVRGNIGNRGFMDNLVGLYKSTAVGNVVSITSSLLDWGVDALVKATKSKRNDWEKAIRGESTFVRRLPMQMEILDFYQTRSSNGPLDPTGMNFNGFGCRQVIEYVDDAGEPKEEEVFYLSCRVRMDEQGIARMLNHSKFEVLIDTLRFNYKLCDLPNDSLGNNLDKRIGFSFAKRSDLRFMVDASITSSWINQALMVYKDQPLGNFHIEASIDPGKIDPDGIFRYYAGADNMGKRVSVSGDCFLVPRSYVGSTDMQNVDDSWGTGQYKVEMTITEACRINEPYYKKEDGSWDGDKWKPEWNLIKSRRRSPSFWRQAWQRISNQYGDSKWVTTLVEPAKTAFIQYETEGMNRLMNVGTQAPVSSSAKTGGATAGAALGGADGAQGGFKK